MHAFRFNDELLLRPADRELAQKRFPSVFFALDHPALREEFARVDALANRAKRHSRTVGLSALGFAIVSLLAFPLEPLIDAIWAQDHRAGEVFRYIAMLGATCGLLAVLFGNFGVWFGKSKRSWLQKRLITERLRHWHAQYLLAHAVEIVAAAHDEAAREAFLADRDLAFGQFKHSFIDQVASEYTKYTLRTAASHSGQTVVNPSGYRSYWIEPAWEKRAARRIGADGQDVLAALYDAYCETRMLGQVQYTNYILSLEGKFWSLPAKQAKILDHLSVGLVLFAFVANFVALISAIWPSFPIGQSVLGSVAISFAILAVGARAVEEGLRPKREIRRMELYAASVQHARDEFAAARTPGKKLAAATLLERASFEEMVEFLSTNERARFVL